MLINFLKTNHNSKTKNKPCPLIELVKVYDFSNQLIEY